jgi:hypothetical protein
MHVMDGIGKVGHLMAGFLAAVSVFAGVCVVVAQQTDGVCLATILV